MEMKEIYITLALLVASAVLGRLAGLLWKGTMGLLSRKTRTDLDDMIYESGRRPLMFFVTIGGFYLTVLRLISTLTVLAAKPDGVTSVERTMNTIAVLGIINEVFYVLLVLGGTTLAYSILRSAFDWYIRRSTQREDKGLADEFAPLLSRILKGTLFIIALIIILDHFSISITGIVATAWVASLAIGLAAKDSIANMISGFLIMIDRPFRVGDRVELSDGQVGDVKEIGIRSTKILTFDNTLIVIPNTELSTNRVINHSYPTPKVNIRRVVTVAYGSDVAKVQAILLDICTAHPKVLGDPAPKVHFLEFGDSALEFRYSAWVESYRDRLDTIHEINMEINSRFGEEGIEIPFPQQDVHLIHKSAPSGEEHTKA